MPHFVPTSYSEFEAERDVIKLAKAYKGRQWFPQLQSFAIECCQPLLDYFSDESRQSIETARRFVAGSATKAELNAAFKVATDVVNSAVTIEGNTTYYNKPLERSLAEAALACTYHTEHSAIYATTHSLEAHVQIKYEELIAAGSQESEALILTRQFRMTINDQQTTLLRQMVGNPFPG